MIKNVRLVFWFPFVVQVGTLWFAPDYPFKEFVLPPTTLTGQIADTLYGWAFIGSALYFYPLLWIFYNVTLRPMEDSTILQGLWMSSAMFLWSWLLDMFFCKIGGAISRKLSVNNAEHGSRTVESRR